MPLLSAPELWRFLSSMCPEFPVRVYMEARITVAWDISKDITGQYYGYDVGVQGVIDSDASPRDYRQAVFYTLDVISADSLAIVSQQHLATPVASFSLSANVTSQSNVTFDIGTIAYQNGTVTRLYGDLENGLAEAEIYRHSITNLMVIVHHAVELDLGNPGSGNIFINPAAINATLDPNIAPVGIDPQNWMGGGNDSFIYGFLPSPYQTWAQMIRAGLPERIPFGNLTGRPLDSKLVTSYLCPVYRLKPISTLLANVFIGTMTMFLSVWATWMTLSAMVVKRMKGPCMSSWGARRALL
ncbi:unnamed protein product [Rhizoctonia solani]|uniref:Uncharacterized protein n=1 Tax=Rhizoctonia solani TaxID=456999 RepID=A0A8H3B684_9AGAM|nr:unnamed protein product [Rhizoctonia solani]